MVNHSRRLLSLVCKMIVKQICVSKKSFFHSNFTLTLTCSGQIKYSKCQNSFFSFFFNFFLKINDEIQILKGFSYFSFFIHSAKFFTWCLISTSNGFSPHELMFIYILRGFFQKQIIQFWKTIGF